MISVIVIAILVVILIVLELRTQHKVEYLKKNGLPFESRR